MKMFLGHAGTFLQAKNNLEKAVQQLITDYDRELYKDSEIEAAKERIIKDIDSINERFPRCTKVRAYWWSPDADDDDVRDWILGIDPNKCVSFAFYQSKEV